MNFVESTLFNVSVVCTGLFMIGFFLGCMYANYICKKRIHLLKKAQKRHIENMQSKHRKEQQARWPPRDRERDRDRSRDEYESR